jgi:hypothetical protein
VQTARHDFAISFHGQSFAGQSAGIQQFSDSAGCGQLFRLAIYSEFKHDQILLEQASARQGDGSPERCQRNERQCTQMKCNVRWHVTKNQWPNQCDGMGQR